jgi:NAD-dependent SIR2 family protein deacetylase
MVDTYAQGAQLIREKGNIVAFTGAGISVESGMLGLGL